MDIDRQIFEFIYSEALGDSVQQRSYEGIKTWINDVEEPKYLIREYVDNVIHGLYKSKEHHDKDFYILIENVCKEINETGKRKNPGHVNEFTFGNAQKLINMIIKHFYVIVYYNKELKNNFMYCHCPVDSIMLNKIWEESKLLNISSDLGVKSQFITSWGKEQLNDNNRYKTFQNAVAELSNIKKMNPVEYDYYMWNKKF